MDPKAAVVWLRGGLITAQSQMLPKCLIITPLDHYRPCILCLGLYLHTIKVEPYDVPSNVKLVVWHPSMTLTTELNVRPSVGAVTPLVCANRSAR